MRLDMPGALPAMLACATSLTTPTTARQLALNTTKRNQHRKRSKTLVLQNTEGRVAGFVFGE